MSWQIPWEAESLLGSSEPLSRKQNTHGPGCCHWKAAWLYSAGMIFACCRLGTSQDLLVSVITRAPQRTNSNLRDIISDIERQCEPWLPGHGLERLRSGCLMSRHASHLVRKCNRSIVRCCASEKAAGFKLIRDPQMHFSTLRDARTPLQWANSDST